MYWVALLTEVHEADMIGRYPGVELKKPISDETGGQLWIGHW